MNSKTKKNMSASAKWKADGIQASRDKRHARENRENTKPIPLHKPPLHPSCGGMPEPNIRYPICYNNQQLQSALQSKRYQIQSNRNKI